MTLEDDLRQMLAARAAGARGFDDPAGRAIRHARVLRRRRAVAAGTAAAVVLVLSLGVVTVLGTGWPAGGDRPVPQEMAGEPAALPLLDSAAAATPTPLPTVGRLAQKAASLAPSAQLRLLGLDLRVGDELWSVTGHRLALTGVGPVTQIYRVPLGWIYGGVREARLLRLDGASIGLGDLGSDWLVSPTGDRLAQVRNRRLAVYGIGKLGLDSGTAVTVPDQTRPVAFAGKWVVITAGDDGPFSALLPGGSDRPVWSDTVVTVYGAGGETVTGLVEDGQRDRVCLAALTVAREGLAVRRSGTCRPASTAAGPGVLAPGGDWLAEPAADGTVLTELASALDGKDASVPCPMASAVAPAWIDDDNLLVSDGRQAIRCRTDGQAHAVPLPDGVSGSEWAFVPKLVPPAGG